MRTETHYKTQVIRRAAGAILSALLCLCLLSGCAGRAETAGGDPVNEASEAVVTEIPAEEAEPEAGFKNDEAKADIENEEDFSDPTAESDTSAAEDSGVKAGAADAEDSSSADSYPAGERSGSIAESGEDGLPEAEDPDEPENDDPGIRAVLEGMSLEAKVAQMFVLLPEQLTGMGQVTQAGDATRAALESFPVGGLIYMEGSLESYSQTQTLLSDTQHLSLEVTGLPMLTFVDEEGGIVTRISGRFPEVPWIESMAAFGARADADEAFQTGQLIGSYLADLGFTCDCAPVADVLTNPNNTAIGERSFGSDPELVAAMSSSLGTGLESSGVTAVYKHFPGHGGTAGDTHDGYAYLDKTLEELYSCELIPFIRAIESGAWMIMAAHISLPNVTSSDLPASLDPEILTDLLRDQLGFHGIIITDALNMGAIASQYTSGEAAIMAVNAGADMILMPADPYAAYYAVIDAVRSGSISEERIDESVRRIIGLKLEH